MVAELYSQEDLDTFYGIFYEVTSAIIERDFTRSESSEVLRNIPSLNRLEILATLEGRLEVLASDPDFSTLNDLNSWYGVFKELPSGTNNEKIDYLRNL
jgi:hypothetical protein